MPSPSSSCGQCIDRSSSAHLQVTATGCGLQSKLGFISLYIFHPSTSLHLPPINLSPSSTHQSLSIFHPSTSLHLPPINLSPSSTHQPLSIFHPSISLHLPPINLSPSSTHQSLSIFHPSTSLHLSTSYHHFPAINLTPPLNIYFHQCHLAFLSLYPSICASVFAVPSTFALITCLALPPSPSPGSPQMVGWWYRVGTTRLSSCGTDK